MKKVFLLSLILISFVVVGCASIVYVTKTGKGYYSNTNPNEVEILVIAPKKDFVELATVITSGWPVANTAKMHNSLRTKCAELGADAVILISSGLDYNGHFWSSGVAIRYKEDK